MSIRGGENIYPRELEELLFKHPKVGEVAVIGVPHEKWGEEVAAFIRPAPGATVEKEELIDYMRDLGGRGYKLAICTNNVREWEHRWRAMLPVDEIFGVIVDSAFVGTRKPEPQIYEITLERLGVAPEAALMVDDLELNCAAARDLGMGAVWFHDNEQAIADIEAALAER